jgi:hypothetical protein
MLIEAPLGESLLGRFRRRWEDNSKVDATKLDCGCVPFINFSECRY